MDREVLVASNNPVEEPSETNASLQQPLTPPDDNSHQRLLLCPEEELNETTTTSVKVGISIQRTVLTKSHHEQQQQQQRLDMFNDESNQEEEEEESSMVGMHHLEKKPCLEHFDANKKKELILTELSTTLNTLISISDVLMDILNLTEPPRLEKNAHPPERTNDAFVIHDIGKPREFHNGRMDRGPSVAVKQYLLMEELHMWKSHR